MPLRTKITPFILVREVISSFDFFQEPMQIDYFIIHFSMKLDPKLTELGAMEILLPYKDKFIEELLKKKTELNQKGLFCPYEILLRENKIVGFSFPRPGESEELMNLRKIAPIHISILNEIQKIDPENFEHFCSKLFELMNAELSIKTQKSHDKGVDFIAQIPYDYDLDNDLGIIKFEKDFKLIILGQAKAYNSKNPVGVSEIRELVGSLFLVKFDPNRLLDLFENSVIVNRLCDPIVPLLMTTGVFTRGAKKEAEKYGVILKNGSQIATYLCLKEIGLKIEDNAYVFDTNLFYSWLDVPDKKETIL